MGAGVSFYQEWVGTGISFSTLAWNWDEINWFGWDRNENPLPCHLSTLQHTDRDTGTTTPIPDCTRFPMSTTRESFDYGRKPKYSAWNPLQ